MFTKFLTGPSRDKVHLCAEERNKNPNFMLHSNFSAPLFQTINKHSANALPFILLKA